MVLTTSMMYAKLC